MSDFKLAIAALAAVFALTLLPVSPPELPATPPSLVGTNGDQAALTAAPDSDKTVVVARKKGGKKGGKK